MSYLPLTVDDRERMLSAVGVASTDNLFEDIPASQRFPELSLPEPLSEAEVVADMASMARKNATMGEYDSFLGAGTYHHYRPSVISPLTSRGEFLTCYTPYQPEASQGTLQAIFEYQTMVAEIFGMEISNASHYDGASALAEAILMAKRIKKNRTSCTIHPDLHPHYHQVIATYLQGQKCRVQVGEIPTNGDACFVLPFPTFTGDLLDMKAIGKKVKDEGALFIVCADPLAMGLFSPPGEAGADIVVGEGQSLGIPPNFGGPRLGLFATKAQLVRQIPGRLIGQTCDKEGRSGCVLTFATREQHIRREKATSNICTSQGVVALTAAIYLAALGKKGLKKVSELCYHKAHYLASEIGKIPGFSLLNTHPFFKEFTVRVPGSAEELVKRVSKHKIIGGLPLSRYEPSRRGDLLICATEMNSRSQMDRFVKTLKEESRA